MKGRIKIWATQLLGNGDVSSHSHISSHPIPKIKAPLISPIPNQALDPQSDEETENPNVNDKPKQQVSYVYFLCEF